MKQLSRRHFLKQSASVGPAFIASSVLGRGRINLACIGVGGQGAGNLHAFLRTSA